MKKRGITVVPEPQEVILREGTWKAPELLSMKADPEVSSEARRKVEEAFARMGRSLRPAVGGTIDFLLAPAGQEVRAEGYRLEVSPKGAILLAQDLRGWEYGGNTLSQLLTEGEVPAVVIRDWPGFPFRGIFLTMRMGPTHPEVLRRLLEDMARYRLKTLILEVNEGIAWESHPEVAAPWALSPEQMKDIVRFGRKLGVKIWPLVQTLHHVEYIILHAHPELTESPDTYCPVHPKTMPLVYDLLEEAMAIFQPEIIHIGHDEVVTDYEPGRRTSILQCPRCREKNPAAWFAEEIRSLYEFLKGRGVGTAMWADMLLNQEQPEGHGGYGGPPDNIFRAAESLPKDILMCDWHYSIGKEYLSLNYLLSLGFKHVLGCPWQEENIYFFSRYAASTPKIQGMLGTNWHPIDSETEGMLRERVRWAGEFFWTPGKGGWMPDRVRKLETVMDEPNPLLDIPPGAFSVQVSLRLEDGGYLWMEHGYSGSPEGWVLKPGGRTGKLTALVTAAEGCCFRDAALRLAFPLLGANTIEVLLEGGETVMLVENGNLADPASMDLTPYVKGHKEFRLKLWARNDTDRMASVLSECKICGWVNG